MGSNPLNNITKVFHIDSNEEVLFPPPGKPSQVVFSFLVTPGPPLAVLVAPNFEFNAMLFRFRAKEFMETQVQDRINQFYKPGVRSLKNTFRAPAPLSPIKDPTLATKVTDFLFTCLLYTSPSPRDATLSRMPSSA